MSEKSHEQQGERGSLLGGGWRGSGMSARTWGRGLGSGTGHSCAGGQPGANPSRNPHRTLCRAVTPPSTHRSPQAPVGTPGTGKHPALQRDAYPPLHSLTQRGSCQRGMTQHRHEPFHHRSQGTPSHLPAAGSSPFAHPRAGGFQPGQLFVLHTQPGTSGIDRNFRHPQRPAATRPWL